MEEIKAEQAKILLSAQLKSLRVKADEFKEAKFKLQPTPVLSQYLSNKADLTALFNNNKDDLTIIKALTNSLALADKAITEQQENHKNTLNQFINIAEKNAELSTPLDAINHLMTHSLGRAVDNLISQKGKGGRAGRKYAEYECIIKPVIQRYVYKGCKKFTQNMALTEIQNAIDKGSIAGGVVNIETLKLWIANFKESDGASIYKQ